MDSHTISLETLLADAVAKALREAYPEQENPVTEITISSQTPGNTFVLVRTREPLPCNVTIQVRPPAKNATQSFSDFIPATAVPSLPTEIPEDAAWDDVERVELPRGHVLVDAPSDEL